MTEHYLEREFYDLMARDREVWDFLQQSSFDALWLYNIKDGESEWMSPRFWRDMGYDPSQAVPNAQERAQLVLPEDLAAAQEQFDSACESGDDQYEALLRFRRRDGSIRWIRSRGLILRDAEGEPDRLVGSHIDLTALHEREEELATLLDALNQSNEQLEQFAYVASHDLRSPLRTIGGFTSLLAEDLGPDAPPEALAAVADIKAEVARMERLIDSLLSFARLRSTTQRRHAVSLDALIDGVLDRLRGELDRVGATVRRPRGLSLWANPEQLGIALYHVILNAVQFRSRDRPLTITIAAVPNANSVELSVSDNGVGLSGTNGDALTGMFTRGGHPEAGAGVGLALCRRIVEGHGGTVQLRAAEPHGATVHFVLPNE